MENLDSDFNVLKIDRNVEERKTHLCTYVLWPVSFKNFKITIHLFVDILKM